MKTIVVVAMLCGVALCLGCVGVARAQQSGGPAAAQSGGGAGKMSADTPEDDVALNLTDEQKAKIKAIRDDAQQQIQATHKDSSLSDEARQRKLKVIRKDTRRQVWGVMTPEQQKQWAAEQRELREHKHGGGAAAEGKPQT